MSLTFPQFHLLFTSLLTSHRYDCGHAIKRFGDKDGGGMTSAAPGQAAPTAAAVVQHQHQQQQCLQALTKFRKPFRTAPVRQMPLKPPLPQPPLPPHQLYGPDAIDSFQKDRCSLQHASFPGNTAAAGMCDGSAPVNSGQEAHQGGQSSSDEGEPCPAAWENLVRSKAVRLCLNARSSETSHAHQQC